MTPKRVLVTGATGKQGGAVARVLIEGGHDVRGLTRDPERPEAVGLRGLGVDVVRGDYSDRETLREAMRDVDAAFIVATPFERGPEAETEHAIAAVDAATHAGVAHIVYSSVACADKQTGIPHFESKRRVEEYVERTRVPFTIVAPAYFMENLLSPWMLPSLAGGEVSMPLPRQTRLQMVGLQEIARFVGVVMDRPEASVGRRYDIASDEIAVGQMADVITRASGRRIVYDQMPRDAARASMGEEGVMMHEWFENGGFDVDIDRLRRDFPGVGWRTFEQWAAAQDWSFLHPALGVHAAGT